MDVLSPPSARAVRTDSSDGRRLRLLMTVGLISGLASGLFGIGGGTVTVPLLLLFLRYGEREATGTSLAAMVVTALLGSAVHYGYGNVDVSDAALVGVPAIGGVMLGTWIQQRLDTRWIGLLFSLLLLVVAIELLVP